MFLAVHYRRSGSRSIWPRGHHSPFMRLSCFFPRPHVRLVWEPLRILWGPIATAEELTQSSKGRITMRASAAVATGNQVTRGFHAECTSCTSCCPPWRTQASHPEPTGSTSYSVGKAALAARSARADPRHTAPSLPSHRSRVRLHSEESGRSRVVTSSAAASDDAVHAVRY